MESLGCKDELEPSLPSPPENLLGCDGGPAFSLQQGCLLLSTGSGLPLEVHLGSAGLMEASRDLSKKLAQVPIGVGGIVLEGKDRVLRALLCFCGGGEWGTGSVRPSHLFSARLPPPHTCPPHSLSLAPFGQVYPLTCYGTCPRRDSCRQSSLGKLPGLSTVSTA